MISTSTHVGLVFCASVVSVLEDDDNDEAEFDEGEEVDFVEDVVSVLLGESRDPVRAGDDATGEIVVDDDD